MIGLNLKEPQTDLSFELLPIKNVSVNSDSDSENLTDKFIRIYNMISQEISYAQQMKEFLESGHSIWRLLDALQPEEVEQVAPIITSMYFSLPEKVCSISKIRTDEFYFEAPFTKFTRESLKAEAHAMTEEKFKRFSIALEYLNDFGIPVFKCSFEEFLQCITCSSLQHITKVNVFFSQLIPVVPSHCMPDLLSKNQQVKFLEIAQHAVDTGLWSFKELSIFLYSLPDNSVPTALAKKLVLKWANRSCTLNDSFSIQLYHSSALLVALSHTSSDSFHANGLESNFLAGIECRMEHVDPQIRLIGLTVGEFINHFTLSTDDDVKKLEFELDSKNEIVMYLRDCYYYSGNFGYGPRRQGIVGNDMRDEEHTIIEKSLPAESEPKNAKTKLPIFLSESLKVLRQNENPELVEKVMTRLGSTYDNSSRIDKQLNAVSVFTCLSTMSEKFEIQDLDSKRFEIMERVTLEHLSIISPLIVEELFNSGRLVLNQKLEYLRVISGVTQRAFSLKTKGAHQTSAISNFLDYFESSYQSLEPVSKAKRTDPELLRNLYLPLLKKGIRNFEIFNRTHAMFFDKFMWLMAIVLNVCVHQVEFSELVSRYLDLALIASKTELMMQAPVKKATLLGLSVVLQNWPSSMPLIDNYERLNRVYEFATAIDFESDTDMAQLLSSVVLALQNLCNPENLIKESNERFSLDFSSIKI